MFLFTLIVEHCFWMVMPNNQLVVSRLSLSHLTHLMGLTRFPFCLVCIYFSSAGGGLLDSLLIMKEIKFTSNHFKDILRECQKHQDLAITCSNGKFQCNSFLFATVFPKLSKVLQFENSDYENNPSLVVPDVDVNDLHCFFNNIYSEKSKFVPGKSLIYLLSWKDKSVSMTSKHLQEIVKENIKDIVKEEVEFDLTENNEIDDVNGDDDYNPLNDFNPSEDSPVKIDILKSKQPEIKKKRGRPRKVIDENVVVKESFHCDQCTKSFKSKLALTNHIIHLHDGVPWPKRPKQKKTRTRHLEECDKICDCGINFKNQEEKLKHYRIVHKGWIECPDCERLVKEHLFGSHKCDPQDKGKGKGGICPHCGKFCETYGSLYYHKNIAHENGSYPCDSCGKIFPSKVNLDDHVKRSCQAAIIPCTICGAMVKRMREHMHAVHLDDKEKRFQCGICGKGFFAEKKLRIHEMSMHIKSRPHRCRYGCDVGYNDISNRNAHERKTHGQRFELLNQKPE